MSVEKKSLEYGVGSISISQDIEDFILLDIAYSGNPTIIGNFSSDNCYMAYNNGRLIIVRLNGNIPPTKLITYTGNMDIHICKAYTERTPNEYQAITATKITDEMNKVKGAWGADKTKMKDKVISDYNNKRNKELNNGK